MAEIKKIYDDAARTTQVYPQTHERAVVDNNGTTAETKFQMITDLVNQKQMEIGAVPSDLAPTKDSTNWVTSGGVYNELFSEGEKTPDVSWYKRLQKTTATIGAEGGYESSTKRVSVQLPLGAVSVTFNSLTSGYHASLQEWNAENPAAPIESMTGTLTADSGWKEVADMPVTIEKLPSSNYLVVCIAKTNEQSLTVDNALSALSFSFQFSYNKIDALGLQIDGLKDDVYGRDSSYTIDNENAQSTNWDEYSGGGSLMRGYFKVLLDSLVFQSYSVSLSVGDNSTIKVAARIQADTTPTGVAVYDSGWVTPGGSLSFGSAKDPTNIGKMLVLAATDVDTGTLAPSFSDFLQYCTFEISFYNKVDGIIPTVERLEKMKCLLASTNIKMVAHRGFHLNGIPENSLDAYRWAGYLGFDLAETDFCPTADDKLVLMHDASINRTMKNADGYTNISGTVNVVSKTLAELRANYVLASDDPRYRRPIPTLEEYFVVCRESNLFPIPEIKQSGTTQEHVLAAYNMGKQIMGDGNFGFCSFSYALLDYARSLDENIPLWYIGASILGTNNSITGQSRETPKTVWYPSYNGSYSYSLSSELIPQYHAKGMQVAVWTVPVSEFDNMLKLGVDYIATDTSGSNLFKTDGMVYDEKDLETNGAVTENGIVLSADQYATIQGTTMEIGIYYVSVIASGNYTITAPNLSETINDAGYTRRVWQGLIDNKNATITITAVGATTIQFVNAKIVLVK